MRDMLVWNIKVFLLFRRNRFFFQLVSVLKFICIGNQFMLWIPISGTQIFVRRIVEQKPNRKISRLEQILQRMRCRQTRCLIGHQFCVKIFFGNTSQLLKWKYNVKTQNVIKNYLAIRGEQVKVKLVLLCVWLCKVGMLYTANIVSQAYHL